MVFHIKLACLILDTCIIICKDWWEIITDSKYNYFVHFSHFK